MQKTHEMELFTKHTPPNIEQLFGYQKHRPWVAFFWGKKVDDAAQGYCFDGESFNPLNQLAWDTFFNHALMVALNHQWADGRAKKKFDFGDTRQTSTHWLLLDRRARILFAAPKTNAVHYLQAAAREEDDQTSHVTSDPDALDLPDRLTSPADSGSLQRIVEMTTWLDTRKALLEKNEQWPILT